MRGELLQRCNRLTVSALNRLLSKDLSEVFRTLWTGKRIVFTPDTLLQTVWRLCSQFKGFKQQARAAAQRELSRL